MSAGESDHPGETPLVLRVRAERARRLAREIGDYAAASNLRALADELDAKAAELETGQNRPDQ